MAKMPQYIHRGGKPTRRQQALLIEILAFGGKLGVQSILDDFTRKTMYLVEDAGWTKWVDASDVMGAYRLTKAGRKQLSG